jgi:hypothetical protein
MPITPRHAGEAGFAEKCGRLSRMNRTAYVDVMRFPWAFAALLFLDKVVLDRPLEWDGDDVTRAKRPEWLRVLLTPVEVRALRDPVEGVPRLMAVFASVFRRTGTPRIWRCRRSARDQCATAVIELTSSLASDLLRISLPSLCTIPPIARIEGYRALGNDVSRPRGTADFTIQRRTSSLEWLPLVGINEPRASCWPHSVREETRGEHGGEVRKRLLGGSRPQSWSNAWQRPRESWTDGHRDGAPFLRSRRRIERECVPH